MLELSLWTIVAIAITAFLCEYMDSTLGMGYGTTLAPVFLLMGRCKLCRQSYYPN